MASCSTTRVTAGLSRPATARDERANDEFERLLAQTGINRFLKGHVPIDLRGIARSLGAKGVAVADIQAAGMLLPMENSFMIFVNKSHHLTRQRFSCAHEIAHALFDPKFSPALRQLEFTSGDELEKRCEQLASFILMPNPIFRRQANASVASIKAIANLARTFVASIQATALRFIEEVNEECVLLVSRSEGGASGSRLRVQWSSHNVVNTYGRPRFFVPRGAHLRLRSAMLAYCDQGIKTSREAIDLGNLRAKTYTESKKFGTGDAAYVLTLLLLSRA